MKYYFAKMPLFRDDKSNYEEISYQMLKEVAKIWTKDDDVSVVVYNEFLSNENEIYFSFEQFEC